jgi:O-acetyl-ADP-ribose deacetylase (regulator of RNase III)
MKEVKGNLVKMAKRGDFDVIVQGCNCFCVQGAGLAKQISEEFPEAYEADKTTRVGCNRKLGTYTSAHIKEYDFTVINAYTQYAFGTGNHADLDSIKSAMTQIAADFPDARIGLPMISAGLAGGDWKQIKPILEESFANSDATLVIYAP